MSEKRRVLLVDDSLQYSRLVAHMHGALNPGFDLVVAADGKSGLAMLREDPANILVLLDLSMPEMDGFEVLTAARSEKPLADVPIWVFTGSSYREDEAHAAQLGATSFIPKPLTLAGFKALFGTIESTWELIH